MLAIILLVVPVSVTAAADAEPQVLFNRGNYLLGDQDYTGALKIYRDIENQGYESGPLFYNMGISYVFLDSLGKASYYFHKSARFRDTGYRADAGITFVEDQMRNRGTYIPGLPWYAVTDRLLFEVNYTRWIIRGLILLNLGVLLLLFGWKYRPDQYILYGGSALAISGLLIIILCTSLYIWSNNHERAIVVESRISLHSDPEKAIQPSNNNGSGIDDASDLAYEGYTVTLNRRISREHPGHVYIRLRNGVTGWIPESSVCIL